MGYGSITSSYATGDPDGGDGNNDYVGGLVTELGDPGLVGYQNLVAARSPPAMPQVIPMGGMGMVTMLAAWWGIRIAMARITSSYGFGTHVNGETPNTHGALPSEVTSASGLTQTNSGDSDTNRWSIDAWDFGTSSQEPALKYVDGAVLGDHDEDDTTAETYAYTCTSNTAFLPPIDIICGTTLLPDQGR